MSSENPEKKILLPHHEQQKLCTTRLPYRQGRKLTAVKVYSINNESNHLLVFGIPSLNLRQEGRALFSKFGRLLQFSISPNHPAEPFTETYQVTYENIQSARIAKQMLDTKNFYGGSLHVCYAPEMETVEETQKKLFLRQRDVLNRLKNLQRDAERNKTVVAKPLEEEKKNIIKLNMGEINTICIGPQIKDVSKSNKRNVVDKSVVIEKKFKPCFVDTKNSKNNTETEVSGETSKNISNNKEFITYYSNKDIEVVDCTSVDTETITNINEHLNYNKFGNEIVRKIPEKPVNKIKFNVSNKKL